MSSALNSNFHILNLSYRMLYVINLLDAYSVTSRGNSDMSFDLFREQQQSGPSRSEEPRVREDRHADR